MADELLPYYERELSFIRQLSGEFAAKYPKIAGRLLLEKDKCEDPHVERLLEAFALMAARIHYRLDADLPEIAEALLGVLYPHYLAPVPSMAIVEFQLDPDQGALTSGHLIDRGALLFSRPVSGYQCRFRTAYPVTIWPLQIATVQLEAPGRLGVAANAAQVLRIEIAKVGSGSLAELKGLDRLRFYVDGESQLVATLYETLFNNVREIQVRGLGKQGSAVETLSSEHISAVGFDRDESLLPYPDRSLDAYRILHEYFAFQEKFLFFDLSGLRSAASTAGADRLEIVFALKRPVRLEQTIGTDNFRLGCTPIVNLFQQRAEPIRVDQTATEYRVVPDVRRQAALEVYSIDAVTGSHPDTPQPLRYDPFYSIKHVFAHEAGRAYWHAHRRPSQKRLDPGTEVYLSLVDLQFRPTRPATETLVVDTWCTNRDLPGKLPFGGDGGDLQLEGAAPVRRIRCLTKPTETIRPPLRSSLQWRLISHLSLNYLSISDGPEALQEILRLYDFSNSATVQQRIAGISKIANRRVVARPQSMSWDGFCRGVEIEIEFDEEKYVGMGLYLFASVLERFLGLYASLNSFVQLVATTTQREEPLRRWPPRVGDRILL